MSEHYLSETGLTSYWYPVEDFCSFHLSILKKTKSHLVKKKKKQILQINDPPGLSKVAEKRSYIFKLFLQAYTK